MSQFSGLRTVPLDSHIHRTSPQSADADSGPDAGAGLSISIYDVLPWNAVASGTQSANWNS